MCGCGCHPDFVIQVGVGDEGVFVGHGGGKRLGVGVAVGVQITYSFPSGYRSCLNKPLDLWFEIACNGRNSSKLSTLWFRYTAAQYHAISLSRGIIMVMTLERNNNDNNDDGEDDDDDDDDDDGDDDWTVPYSHRSGCCSEIVPSDRKGSPFSWYPASVSHLIPSICQSSFIHTLHWNQWRTLTFVFELFFH